MSSFDNGVQIREYSGHLSRAIMQSILRNGGNVAKLRVVSSLWKLMPAAMIFNGVMSPCKCRKTHVSSRRQTTGNLPCNLNV